MNLTSNTDLLYCIYDLDVGVLFSVCSSLDSHRSATSTPATYRRNSPTVEDMILDSEDRMAMNNATRSIARLAAKRRGGRSIAPKAKHNDPDRNLYRYVPHLFFYLPW